MLRLKSREIDMKIPPEQEEENCLLLTREVVVCDFACTEFAGRDLVRKRSRRGI